KQLRPEERFNYLCVIGLIVANSRPNEGTSYEIKNYLVRAYQKALSDVWPLFGETLPCQHDAVETRYLLASIAVLKGHRKLALVLHDMDAIYGECSKCGEHVYPDELQEALS